MTEKEKTLEILKQVETQVKQQFNNSVEALKEANLTQNKDNEEKVKGLNDLIEKNSQQLEQIKQQIATISTCSVPGAEKEIKDFSLHALCKAALKRKEGSIGDKVWEGGGELTRDLYKSYIENVNKRTVDTGLEISKAANNFSTDGSAGSYLIPPEVAEVVNTIAYARVPLLGVLPTRKISGLRGDFQIPKLTAGPTAYSVGENEQPTSSGNTYGELWARPHRIAAYTKQSRQLIYQSTGVAEQLIREALGKEMGIRKHQRYVNGTGANDQSKGLLNWSGDFTSNNAAIGTNGGPMSIYTAALMKKAIEDADKGNDSPTSYGFLMHPSSKWAMMTQTVKQYSAQTRKDGQPVWNEKMLLSEDDLRGYIGAFGTSTQIPKTETKGTSSTCSKVIYGNWSDFWIMTWEGMEMRVSDVASDGTDNAFTQNLVMFVLQENSDCVVVDGASFTQIADSETNESLWT